jgi:hypothetical protein
MTAPASRDGLAHSKAFRLAAVAYHAALASRPRAAVAALKRISDECGGEGLAIGLAAWCDTYIDHATDGAMTVGGVNLAYIRTDTGQLDRQGSDRVPPEVQWAGQLLTSRIARDEQRWRETIAELPEDGRLVCEYVYALLKVVAATVNGLPRGYVLMGRLPAGDASGDERP